jgi:hypothetical protein
VSAPAKVVPPAVRGEVLRLRELGGSMRLIGERLGISRDRVRAVLVDAGLAGEPRRPARPKRLNVDFNAVHRMERSERARRVNRILAEHGPEGLKMLRRQS